MTTYVCFHLESASLLEETWRQLESLGCQLLYSSEDPEGGAEIYGYQPISLDSSQVKNVLRVAAASLEIDWEAQWASHGLDYHDGYVHVELSRFGFQGSAPVLRLAPGPGFGDLSHATTRMMLKLMPSLISGKQVVDIGSGSGVLSLAACLMGAEQVIGIDIDPEANRHAHDNAVLNGLQNRLLFLLPEQFQLQPREQPLTILMNMIWSEQRTAWQSLSQLHRVSAHLILSGIRVEERAAYLDEIKSLEWKLIEEMNEEGWIALHCVTDGSSSPRLATPL